ncbi:MAG: CoA transferase [Gemmatimonadetes bacterium]|nr:CoA transferase [Gemmatimonadota bacterium]
MSSGERGHRPQQAAQPLTGIRVVDLSQNLAGPYCTQLLADLGADVIKVEPLRGDPARAWGPPFWNGQSTIFLSANRNKRSIAIDLKTGEGREIARRLAETADVFVQSFRAGVIERLGLSWTSLSSLNPALIYCSVTAYGTRGPLQHLPGYDPLMQAHGGLMSLTGSPGAPARVGTSVIDLSTALWAVIGIQAALAQRARTGAGSHVVASLWESALALNSFHLLGYWASGEIPGPMGTAFALIAPYSAYPTLDGQLMIAAANDGLFDRLCTTLDLRDLAGDARFADNPSRVRHRDVLDAAIRERTLTLTTRTLEEMLRGAGVPCAPILDIAGVSAEEHTWTCGILDRGAGPRIPGPAFVGPALAWDGRRALTERPPPLLGEQSAEILDEIGLDPARRAALIDRGIVLQAADSATGADTSSTGQ